MPATLTAIDVRRLSKPELLELDTDEARAELERRKAKRQERGKAYHEKASAEVDRALDDVLAMFDTGDLPAAVARTYIRRLEQDVPSASWSLMNQLIVLLSGTEDARGRKQWEAAGREVRKDARPVYILGPRMVTYKVENEETGEVETRRSMKGFIGIPVYALEDTEGAELEAADYTPAELPPLFEVAERLGIRVRWTHFTKDYAGFYRPALDDITLMSHDERVFLHELAHAAHARVLEAKGRKMKGGQDPAQEIVAETTAAVLCRLFGLDGYLFEGRQYVAAYAAKSGKDLRAAIARVLGDVQACLELLLEGPESSEVSA